MNLRLFFLVCIFVKVFASESLSPINQPLQKHMFLDKTVSLMESIKDPVAFAEVFATANPDTVKKVLVLMEQLANASLVSKQLLVSADVTAEKEVNNTKKNHEEAVKAEDAAKSLYDTAVTIKTQTATSLTDQGPGLDSEHKTIIKVIELLKSLVPNATESPTEAATEGPVPGTVDDNTIWLKNGNFIHCFGGATLTSTTLSCNYPLFNSKTYSTTNYDDNKYLGIYAQDSQYHSSFDWIHENIGPLFFSNSVLDEVRQNGDRSDGLLKTNSEYGIWDCRGTNQNEFCYLRDTVQVFYNTPGCNDHSLGRNGCNQVSSFILKG